MNIKIHLPDPKKCELYNHETKMGCPLLKEVAFFPAHIRWGCQLNYFEGAYHTTDTVNTECPTRPSRCRKENGE